MVGGVGGHLEQQAVIEVDDRRLFFGQLIHELQQFDLCLVIYVIRLGAHVFGHLNLISLLIIRSLKLVLVVVVFLNHCHIFFILKWDQ